MLIFSAPFGDLSLLLLSLSLLLLLLLLFCCFVGAAAAVPLTRQLGRTSNAAQFNQGVTLL
jgi:hypothetical protein